MTHTFLSIPYQAFDVHHVYLSPFQTDKYGKRMAHLTYKDPSVDFNDVCILSPPLRVMDYQPETSRLRLDMSDQPIFQNKLNTLYEYLISTFYVNQHNILHIQNRPIEAIRQLFYFLIEGPVLSLYLYPTAYVKGENTTSRITEIQSGNRIRCAIRFQGVSLLSHRDGMRLRLHHSLPMVWKVEG
jgi:hypothetical protein